MQTNISLDEEEKAMLAGELGPARQWAIKHQIAVGEFFDAKDFVRVAQAHIMADTEATGEAGVSFVEGLASMPEEARRVRIPTITDPRGVDFEAYKRLKQTEGMAKIEDRLIRAFEALGVLMTNTCINYQTILPPVRGEHLAFGDTGVVIYSNSVLGACSNFEGGPSALSAPVGRRVTGTTLNSTVSAQGISRSPGSRAISATGARLERLLASARTAIGPFLSSPGLRKLRIRTNSSISERRWLASAPWPCSIFRA